MDAIERLAALERLATAARFTMAPGFEGRREIERAWIAADADGEFAIERCRRNWKRYGSDPTNGWCSERPVAPSGGIDPVAPGAGG